MKIFNKTFNNIDEVAQYIADNIEEIQGIWYEGNIYVTADKKWRVCISSDQYYLNALMGRDKTIIRTSGYNKDLREVICQNCAYLISELNMKNNFLNARRRGRYYVSSAVIELFNEVLLPGECFVFDEPCDDKGSYDIYAIKNVGGIIMAEFVSNANKMEGLDTHEVGTKGTQSWAIVEAWRKYEKGEGHMEFDPEAAKEFAYTVGI